MQWQRGKRIEMLKSKSTWGLMKKLLDSESHTPVTVVMHGKDFKLPWSCFLTCKMGVIIFNNDIYLERSYE